MRIVLEDVRRAVALMHVQVDYGGALCAAFRSQPENRYRDIVEDAETGSLGSKSVMRAARQVSAPASSERVRGGGQRSSHGAERALNQTFGPGESDAADGVRRQGPVQERVDIAGMVGELYDGRIGERSAFEMVEAVGGEQVPYER